MPFLTPWSDTSENFELLLSELQLLVNEKLEKITAEIQHVKEVSHIRSESVEQKTKQVAVKLEEKRKTVEAKQEAARIEFQKQRQAKQERFKDVLQQAHEKEELLVKVCSSVRTDCLDDTGVWCMTRCCSSANGL